MSAPRHFAVSAEDFAELLADVQQQLNPAARLPNWPFLAPVGFVTIYEYDRMLGGSFGEVVQALAQAHGDRTVTVVGLDPPATYYHREYGVLPGFRIAGDSLGESYADAMYYEPGGDPTGALGFSMNAVAMVGSSGVWSAWGQRDWEIGLVLTPESEGPWLQQPVAWFSRDVNLDEIRSPVGWGVPLSEQECSRFWRNVRERGSGP